jgi:3-oxoacyl-[acyl-carrier-protein] synthase II
MTRPTRRRQADARRAVITGMGVISSLGDTPALVSAALCSGRSGVGPVELFEVDGLRCREAGEVRGFSARTYLGDGNLRPLDRTAQLAASAAQLALSASGWSAERLAEHEVGLALGTMFGSVHTISEFDRRALTAGPLYAQPMAFANSVINAAAGQTAIWHGLKGVNSTISGGTASGLQALIYAADLIRDGRTRTILAGGADELCFETFYGFYRSGRMAGSSNGRGPLAIPFDARRNGFALGEGAALLVLEEAGSARSRGARVLGEITGRGMCYDVSRGTDPARSAGAVARAIRAALAAAGLEPDQIDAASAAANGSVAGDRAEALGIAEVCGGKLPVTAVKSMLGEALGASGALQTVALVQSMASGVLPGVHGLQQVDDGVPPGLASGDNRELEIRRGLVTAVGLDGTCCALIVESAGSA